MKVVLTGGGTGGHTYPAISAGQAIRRISPDADLLFLGSSHGPEGSVAAEYGFEFIPIASSPLSGSASLASTKAIGRLGLGIFRALRILKRFKPDVVLGTGGYTSAAVLFAQKLRRGRLVLHEQNAVPGRTNLWLSRWACRVCVSFEESGRYFNRVNVNKIVHTGMPVREEFQDAISKQEARRRFGLSPDLFTLLVIGGSQGAKRLNDIVPEVWKMLSSRQMQILHQCGARNFESARDQAVRAGLGESYHVEGYVDMPAALAASDLVISRSGASSLAEISAAGLCSVLVPYPFAYADHQKRNAEVFCQRRAAFMLEDQSLKAESLANVAAGLMDRDRLRVSMGNRAVGILGNDAAEAIARAILSI